MAVARAEAGMASAPAPASGLGARRRRGQDRRASAFLGFVATHAIAIALAVAFLAPLVFVLLTAVMSDQQTLTGQLWPRRWVWGNFAEVFRRAPLVTWFGNTLLYAGLATVLMLASSIPVGYALAKMRFRGRRIAFLLVLSAMMLPPQVVVVPLYILWARLHLTGTLWPLIIPLAFGDAFSIFLLRQFLLTIPDEYRDAAKVDGCGELRTLVRVILPMARPAIAAVALFQFFYAWNDYYGPLVYTGSSPAHWTLAVGLASFKTTHQVQWNLTMAATLLVMAPVLIVFFFAQRAFIEGVTLTGVKG